MKKIEIYCPLFTWFYNTIHEINDEQIINSYKPNEYTWEWWSEKFYELYEINYKERNIEYSKEYVKELIKNIRNIEYENNLNFGIEEINFISLESPKYYNYKNDEINISISINDDFYKKTLEYLKSDNKFKDFIEKEFKIRDGFIPYGSDDVNDWYDLLSTKIDELAPYHYTTILEFILLNNNIDDQKIAIDIYDNWFDDYEYVISKYT